MRCFIVRRRTCQTLPWRPSSRPALEDLEDRTVLSAFLSLTGPQTLVPGANIDASNNGLTAESEMQISINPADPMQIAGFTENAINFNEMSVYWSHNGGGAWNRTVISAAKSHGNLHFFARIIGISS